MATRLKEVCSNCGVKFTCSPEFGEEKCWCDSLPQVVLVPNQDQSCLCAKCLRDVIQKLGGRIVPAEKVRPSRKDRLNDQDSLVEGEDYYLEGENFVFTARYHLRRGYCCENGCRHCPYETDFQNAKRHQT